EIRVALFNGTNWDIKTLTNNEIMDITPKVATNGSNSVVVWTQGGLENYCVDKGLPVIEFSESRLMVVQYNGFSWSEPAQLYLPSGGKLAEYSVAMADDGS
ncbi:MAG TPA: hypothetical protein DDY25_05925, partial [Peptococcaceae bacterium]|nr:hypothetical protein [Peptococcaceae bacterium]